MRFVDKYRPRSLSELVGQEHAVAVLRKFLKSPYGEAFLFHGPTGTGKSTAAECLARELGVSFENDTGRGIQVLASGEQDKAAVRELMASMSFCAGGSGWKLAIINECDFMTPHAAQVWFDALEYLPPSSVIIFTTNDPSKLPKRFRHRCKNIPFPGDAMFGLEAADVLIERIWRAEGAPIDYLPGAASLDVIDYDDGEPTLSFRAVVRAVESALEALPVALGEVA